MQAKCVHCGTEHKLKDANSTLHPKVQFKCSKCGKTTVVELKLRPDQTVVISPLPSFARADASTSNLHLPPEDDGMKLPWIVYLSLRSHRGPQTASFLDWRNRVL